ncbi:metal ABC transporter substrate-binding protein [Nocardioides massiliensis]|uniref:Zinc transport system substrate-binding protein n=1 Tax=Nocardioides massiliensis TaxID=1325935 RepID=A0ABT9NPU9_9ACTN|nr:metal ABC transporter substrate-binding protein [Nocardioides massiliensis]MDP9822454.1 zinc transport system substrate-binding protein [Nocardioides massiliensis]
MTVAPRTSRTPFFRLSAAAAALPLLLTLAACGDDAGAGDQGGVDVVVAIYPLEYVATRVGGEHVTVETLTPPGAEPHDHELTVRQTAAVAEAELVGYVAGFQPAVDTVVSQQARDTAVDVPYPRREFGAPADEHEGDDHDSDHGDDHAAEHRDKGPQDGPNGGHDHEHDHGDEDPHVWLDPRALVATANAYAERLADVDPDHAEDYTANAAAVVADLEQLDTAYAEGLASCERQQVVVSHDAFGYLSRYGLEFASIAGISPDAEPSPARLAELGDLIEDTGVTTVFTETLASPALAETLASALDITTAVLDPVEGLTEATADEDYLSLMEANLAALRQANDCA